MIVQPVYEHRGGRGRPRRVRWALTPESADEFERLQLPRPPIGQLTDCINAPDCRHRSRRDDYGCPTACSTCRARDSRAARGLPGGRRRAPRRRELHTDLDAVDPERFEQTVRHGDAGAIDGAELERVSHALAGRMTVSKVPAGATVICPACLRRFFRLTPAGRCVECTVETGEGSR